MKQETKKVVFLGSKPIGYDCLKALIQQKATLSIEIVGVLTNTKASIQQNTKHIPTLCQQYDIPVYANLKEYLSIPEVDIAISVQYHQILRQIHIDKAQQLAVNLHMAPLPEYRGCNQFSFAILDQSPIFGTTLHQMTTAVDGGDILFEDRFSIPTNCMVTELYQLTVQKSLALFKRHLIDLVSGNYTPIAQKELLEKRSTSYHYRHEIKNIKQLDWSWSAEKIQRHFRATYFPPFEPPYFMLDGEKVYLTKEGVSY